MRLCLVQIHLAIFACVRICLRPFLSNICKIFSFKKVSPRKKPRNLLRGFRRFFPCCCAALPPAMCHGILLLPFWTHYPLPAHPTRPLSVQGLPFSRTAFVCHISVSSPSFSLPASASSSKAGANAQRLGQSSIERRRSDTLSPCQLKSVQSVPS